jgi:hypothetical protein
MGKRRKRSGHYCWCCGCQRPNERFSGGGHARHICKQCSKLGKEELAFRSAVRNIDRMRPRDRVALQKIADTHAEDRVREYAAEVLEDWRLEREEWRAEAREYAEQLEALMQEAEMEEARQLEDEVFGPRRLEAEVFEADLLDADLLDAGLLDAEVFEDDPWA